jgi:transcriptional antiterminator RfaH
MLDGHTTAALASHNPMPDPPGHLGCYSIRGPRWACVYTHPQAELWADSNLRRSGYQTFLPTHLVRQRDRVVPSMHHVVSRPLFPRYLFMLFDHLAASWSPIRATPGVADIVRAGSDPLYVPEATVSALQATQDARQALPAPEHHWAPGTPCTPLLGPMRGLPAVVLSIDHETATIGLMFLGQLRQISMNVDCLTARDE